MVYCYVRRIYIKRCIPTYWVMTFLQIAHLLNCKIYYSQALLIAMKIKNQLDTARLCLLCNTSFINAIVLIIKLIEIKALVR